jgi:putative endonuclease
MTDDLRQRLREHNAGESSYTAKFRPWKLTTYVAFTDPAKAEAFERYLKSGSGPAFARSGCGSHVAFLPLPKRFSCSLTFLDHMQFLAQLDPAAVWQDAAEIYARVNHAIAADNRPGIDHRIAADLCSVADDCAEFS